MQSVQSQTWRTIHKNFCHKAETPELETPMEQTSKSTLATDAEAPIEKKKEK